MNPTNHLDRLRARTQTIHKSTEVLVESHRLLDGSPSKAHYCRLLRAHLGLHLQLQCHIAELADNRPAGDLLDWPDCHRIAALHRDLEVLGESYVSTSPVTPTTVTRAFSIGLLYVCEGSCLGNQQLMTAMSTSESFRSWEASAFFASCNQGFGLRWRTVLGLIETTTEVQYEELEDGALFGFDAFKHSWLSAGS